MSEHSRAFPARPNLRYLKIEAKRRLAAGEFATLHDAQLAIAREHGMPSWAALKEFVSAEAGPDRHALSQVKWVAARFAGAGTPHWAAPGEDELRAHFHDRFLERIPPETIVSSLARVSDKFQAELMIVDRKSTRLNSSHLAVSRMPSSA